MYVDLTQEAQYNTIPMTKMPFILRISAVLFLEMKNLLPVIFISDLILLPLLAIKTKIPVNK